MNKNLTEIVFLLDRSGSMSGLETDTIGGFNAMLEKQKQEPGEAILSAVLFDHESEVVYDRVDIRRAEPMTEKQYYVRGSTALLDAIGGAVRHIETAHRYAREEDRPGKTIFVITTDGMENASRRWTYRDVRELVERVKEVHGWEFLFLGANMDAISAAADLGISADRAVRYEHDSVGTALNFHAVGKAVCAMRCNAPLTADWKEEIDRDFKKRHRGR
ncbi:MAG: VWA domain-containing protein [Clostridia bacterium]|nr:VWA domain-containing protein [Clostridia bacterium]